MKKTIVTLGLLLVTLLSTTAFINNYRYSNGIAGYTGSPGETTCSTPGCHGGGSSATSGVTISATPAFTGNEYVPGTTYTVAVSANAAGFTRYGFGCEILDDNNANIGTMQTAGTGVHFLNSGSRKNAVHTTAKVGSTATFTFKWLAPAAGSGNVNIYAAANAVNGNGNTSGDFPIDPQSLVLGEGAVPVDTSIVTGVRENQATIASHVAVYPNPANGITTISYSLKENAQVSIELIDISGKLVKTLSSEKQTAGDHSQLLSLQNAVPGVYFIKTLVNGEKAAQKLITIQ